MSLLPPGTGSLAHLQLLVVTYFTNLALWGSEICGTFNTVTTSLQYSNFHFRLWGPATEMGWLLSSVGGGAKQSKLEPGASDRVCQCSLVLFSGCWGENVRTYNMAFGIWNCKGQGGMHVHVSWLEACRRERMVGSSQGPNHFHCEKRRPSHHGNNTASQVA